MKPGKWMLLSIFVPAMLFSQGLPDLSPANATLPLGSQEPAICKAGNTYFNVVTGKQRLCNAPNTWTDVGTGSIWTRTPGVISPVNAGDAISNTDISTPSNPSAGSTKLYPKGGKWCSLDPSGNENCTGAASISTVTISSSSPVTVSAASDGYYFWNAAGAVTFNLPAITSNIVGRQLCFRNSATRTGAITLQSPASTTIDSGGTAGTAAGTLVSSGALGDAACVVATSTTTYAAYLQSGAWVNN